MKKIERLYKELEQLHYKRDRESIQAKMEELCTLENRVAIRLARRWCKEYSPGYVGFNEVDKKITLDDHCAFCDKPRDKHVRDKCKDSDLFE